MESKQERQLQLILETVTADTYNVGEEFFEVLVTKLNEVLEADYSFVGKLSENAKEIETISLVNPTGILPNFNYKLKDTPCENVIGQVPCCYPRNVAKLFPNDQLLLDMGIEAYVGVPLYNSKKEPQGILVSLWKREIQHTERAKSILLIYASRSSAELEHLKLYKELELSRSELEATVLARTQELDSKNKALLKLNQDLSDTMERLKDTQSRFVQSEKMASLGLLIAGVAHEINNPLSYVNGAHHGLVKYFETYGSNEEEKTELLLRALSNGVDRISAIVGGLNQFGRSTEHLNEACDIHAILDNCLTMLTYNVDEGVVVEKNLSEEPVIVKGNTGKLHQVFLNIIKNAIQAISGKGRVIITTKVEGNYVSIVFEDNGAGIEQENLSKITDPFFTTKPPGAGTGLGLSIVYSVLEEHKGKMAFESELMKGTKVNVTLPRKK